MRGSCVTRDTPTSPARVASPPLLSEAMKGRTAVAAIAGATAVLLAALAGAVPARSQDEGSQFTYVAGDAQMWAVGVVGQAHDTPAGPLAVATDVDVVPSRSSFTIHLDDYALPDGQQLWVQVRQGERWLFSGCVPVRTETQISGARPGQRTSISFGKFDWTACGLAEATAGVLTVRGLS